MKMSNPVFSSIDNIDWHRSLRQSNTGTVTMDDVIQKTSITLGIIVAFAAANFALAWVVPPLASLLSLIGAIGAMVMVLVSTFGNKFESAGVTIAYAVFEGLMLGGMSTVIASTYTAKWGMVVGQALLGTIAVFIVMLIVYRMKLIEVTQRFKSFIIVMLLGVLAVALVNAIYSVFTGYNPLSGGALGIGCSLVCIVLAALCLILDLDSAEQAVAEGMPRGAAWGIALGFAVTLVWLYVNILNVLRGGGD